MAILFKLINVQSHNSQPFQRLIDAQPFEGTTFKEEVGLVDPFKWARMGSAIYPTLALVNHSCDSNCIRVFIDKKAALITTRVVTAGEELTESYREARAKGFVRVSELCSEHLLMNRPFQLVSNPFTHICTYSGVHHCDTPLFARQLSCQGAYSACLRIKLSQITLTHVFNFRRSSYFSVEYRSPPE